MKRIFLFLSLLLLVAGQGIAKEKSFTLKSPNGKLVTHVVATAEEELTYDIVYRGVTLLLPSHVGLNRQYGKTVTGSMALVQSSTRTIDETIP